MKKNVLVAAVCVALHRAGARVDIAAGADLPADLTKQEFDDLERMKAFREETRDLPDTAGGVIPPNAGVSAEPAPASATAAGDVPAGLAGEAIPGTNTPAAETGDQSADVSAQGAAPAAPDAATSTETASATETGEAPPPGGQADDAAATKPARARKTAVKQ